MVEKNKPGGRPPRDAEASALKMEKQTKKHNKSQGQREAEAKYRNSEKGKEAHKRYQEGPLARVAYDRYYQSDKGQAAIKEVERRQNEKRGITNALRAYLKENPGKTPSDFFAAHPEMLEGGPK